ncbi:uncharacterized protein TNCT_161881 [Trichonephila clavata]|uniref:Uncharacterized protein n=1 Tax=Trichonephila clavata TaxID=2740835 RepID=A0A8X6GQ19_TRICU|nr:uncharacterized protein TNCT_161881 [Trichonephila clavata]
MEKSKTKSKDEEDDFDEIMDESNVQVSNLSKAKEGKSQSQSAKSKKKENVGKSKVQEDSEPKTRSRADAIVESELPDMSSEDIIVEKGGGGGGGKKSRNLMGQKGFVSSLLFDVIHTGQRTPAWPIDDDKSKPVSKQDLQQRKSTAMAVENDIQSHFSKKDLSRKSSMSLKKKKSKSKSRTSDVELRLEDEITIPTKSETLPADLSHLKSGWQPTAEEDEEAPRIGFYRRKQSWVGVYVEGTDYWSKRDSTEDIKPVEFEMDQKGQAWYDIPVAEEVMVEVPLDKKRMISRSKLDELKNRTSQDLLKNADQEKREIFSFDQREPMPEKVCNDLYQMFLEFCKTDDLSAVQNRMSLLNADKCLEQVGLLDHKNLTLIHTGFCFKAAGGSRFRGLTFVEFKIFVEMVAETRDMPVFDFVNKLKLGYAGIIVDDDDN